MSMKKWQHLKIPFEDIKVATNNFQDCIEKGGYGLVYKGELLVSGVITKVAVKRLNETLGQGLKEFLTEIDLLHGQLHPNVISLLGYCDDDKEKIIVYEYAERGSLDKYLRRRGISDSTSLTWLQRLKICADAARGLDHLHNHVGKHQTIIHRDINSANILLDEKWVAKISDLGLSKLSFAGLGRSVVISHACGTPGYVEPEYVYSGTVKKESDVYSFGMVLFEVICGRLCCIQDDDGILLSGKLAKEYYESKKLDKIIDPSLKEEISSYSMTRFSAIAYGCLHNDREERPGMDVVTKELEKILKIQMKLHESVHGPSLTGSDWSSSIGNDDRCVTKAPGVVAIMGLDMQCETDHHFGEYAMRNKLDGFLRNPVEDRLQKLQKRPMERFQTEVLPPSLAKSVPISHHRMLSPIKSPGYILTRNAASIMEAASRIIDQSPQSTHNARLTMTSCVSSPTKRILDLKERMEAAQRTSRIAEASQRPRDGPT